MIRLLLIDVDGVLTDGGLFYGPDGETLKRFDVRDGLGIKLLRKAGVRIAAISGRDMPALRTRLAELGIEEVHAPVADKAAAARQVQAAAGVGADETAAVGDDLPDLALFAHAALRIAPADAEPEVRARADHVTARGGGRGAIRDAARIILAALGTTPLAVFERPAMDRKDFSA